jgi:hypothetical protein
MIERTLSVVQKENDERPPFHSECGARETARTLQLPECRHLWVIRVVSLEDCQSLGSDEFDARFTVPLFSPFHPRGSVDGLLPNNHFAGKHKKAA